MSPKKWLLFPMAVLVMVTCALLLPCCYQVLDGEGWVRSSVSLGRIAQALNFYREEHSRFPPPTVRDKAGKPLYSWRVLLLPYLEEGKLYQQLHLDEPWDSPHNKLLLTLPEGKTPRCYVPALGGNDPPGYTRYQAILGPGTAFEGDPSAEGMLVVEAAEPVPWSKPVDLVYDPKGPLPAMGSPFTKPTKFLCYEVGRKSGFLAAFADRSVRFIASDTAESDIRNLIAHSR